MKGLGPHGVRLLREEDDSFGPPAGARVRVTKGLAARIGAAALGTVVAAETSTAAAGAGSGASAIGGWLTAPAAKVIAVVAAVATVAGGGVAAWHIGAPGVDPVRAGAVAPRAEHDPGVRVGSFAPVSSAREPDGRASSVAPVSAAPPRALPPVEATLAREPPGVTTAAPPLVPPGASSAARSPLGEKRASAPRPSSSAAIVSAGVRAGVAEPIRPPALTAAAPVPAPLALASEAALLRHAQRARVSGDAAQALVLLDRYEDAHPRGALAELARAERVLALCALGRGREARALAGSSAALSLDRGTLRACESR